MQKEQLYSVTSFNVVAWLLSKDLEYKECVRIGNTIYFFFEKGEKLSEALTEYTNNKDLKKFIAQYKKVRDLAMEVLSE